MGLGIRCWSERSELERLTLSFGDTLNNECSNLTSSLFAHNPTNYTSPAGLCGEDLSSKKITVLLIYSRVGEETLNREYPLLSVIEATGV